MTPLLCPLLSPHPWRGQGWPGGLGNPQDKETRTVVKWALGTPTHTLQRQGVGGLAPAYFLPSNSLSIHSPSPGELGAKCWCFHLPEGREEGRAALPWGSSDNGADTSWAGPPPSAHQDPPLAVVQLVPKHRKPQAGFGHTISWPPLPPLPPPITIPHIWGTFDQKNPIGNSSLALVEFIHPSVHPSIHPCPQLTAWHH